MRRPSSMFFRVLRETLLLDIIRDGTRDGNSAQDLAERELALDKALIQLIRHACESSCQARALDFARLLHGFRAFDIAIKLAEAYHLTDLWRCIECLRVERGGPICAEPLASQQVSKPATIDATESVGRSSRKRPADNDALSSVDLDAKRRSVREAAPSTTATDGQALRQTREYFHFFRPFRCIECRCAIAGGSPFLKKPVGKKVKTGPSTLLGYGFETSRKAERIEKDGICTGRQTGR